MVNKSTCVINYTSISQLLKDKTVDLPFLTKLGCVEKCNNSIHSTVKIPGIWLGMIIVDISTYITHISSNKMIEDQKNNSHVKISDNSLTRRHFFY